MYRQYGKRVLDLLVAIPILLLLLPLSLLIALLVKWDSPGPVFFTQERLGRKGTTFLLYKFRTMTDRPRVADTEIIGHAPEVTRVGYWLRRFKLDELVQIVNVIKGDMSLVGPRPALLSQLSELDQESLARLRVRPGLTGLAQINGNIHLSWPERWVYDVQYVEQLSLLLDLTIILRTIAVIFVGESHFVNPPLQQRDGTRSQENLLE